MCQYCNRVLGAIARNNVFWLGGRCQLIIYGGDIRYTKWSRKTGKPYSKTIPIISLCQAKTRFDNSGLNAINRSWHNGLPEGLARPCNLKVIETILRTFQ